MGAKIFLLLGAVYGFFGVAAGAFGAHALKAKLDTHMLGVFETGVKYQMYHAFALLFIFLLASQRSSGFINWAGYLFAVGTLIFSGSLYTLVLTNTKAWGAVTPIGGLLLLVGWFLLIIASFKLSN